MFMGRWGEKEPICAVHAIDTEFLARTVIRAEKGPIDFVIHGIVEFLGEIGRKRIVIRSDSEPAVKALVQAVALHREDETVIEEVPVKSSQSVGCNEHDHFLVGGMARAPRIVMEKRFGDNFPVLHAVCSWILRHSGWLLNRFCVGRDGYTAFQRYKGRIHNGEVCDLFGCALFRVPSPEEAGLDDRFRLGVWMGKTSRGDDHLIFDGDEVQKCRTVKRRPEYLRWDPGRVDAIDAHPQRPRPSQERASRDRPKRCITWSDIKKYGGTPNCKACAVDGPSHPKECRERFEAIFRKEDEEKAMKEAADAAATSVALQDEAATSSMNPPTTTVVGVDPMHVELPRGRGHSSDDHRRCSIFECGSGRQGAGPVRRRDHRGDPEAQRT